MLSNSDMKTYGSDSDNESFYTCIGKYNIKTIVDLEYEMECINVNIENTLLNEEELEHEKRKLEILKDSIDKKHIVKHTFPNVYSKVENIFTDGSCGLIYGEMQTNKTATTLALSLECLSNDYVPIIFCNDSNAVKSLKMKIDSFEKKYEICIPTCDVSDCTVEEGSLISHHKLLENFNGSNPDPPQLCISLAHHCQFRKTEQLLRLARKTFGVEGTRKTCVILDEAHCTMYSDVGKKCRKTDNLDPEKYNITPSIEDSIERLLIMASNIVGVTATPQRLLLEGICGKGIDYFISVPVPEKYVSFENLTYKEIGELDENTKPSEDKELIDFYTNKLNDPLTRAEYPGLDYERKPQLSLVKVTTRLEEHRKIFDNITALDKHTCIETNSNRCRISFTSKFADKVNTLKIGNTTYKMTDYRLFHLKPETHIQEILDEFVKYVDDIENIIIIGGKRMDMSVSVCSSKGELRLNNEFLRLTTDTTADSAEQQNRQNGRIRCPQPVNIYATRRDYLDINKGYKLKRDIVETFENALLNRSLGKIKFRDSIDFFKNVNVNKEKIPKIRFFGGKKGNVRRSRVFNKIVNEEDTLIYCVDDYRQLVRNSMNVDLSDVARECAKQGYSNEFERLTKKMFPKWAKDNTNIGRFMQNLDPIKLYSLNELKELALNSGYEKFYIRHFQLYNTGKTSKGNGKILVKVCNNYKLDDCLVEKFKECFNYTE